MCAIGLNLAEFLMMRPASNGPSELALAQVNQKGSRTRRRLHEHSERQLPVAWLAQPHGQVRERLSPSRTPRTRRAKTRGDSDSWCCQSYAAGEGYRAGPAAYRLAGEQRSSLRL